MGLLAEWMAANGFLMVSKFEVANISTKRYAAAIERNAKAGEVSGSAIVLND